MPDSDLVSLRASHLHDSCDPRANALFELDDIFLGPDPIHVAAQPQFAATDHVVADGAACMVLRPGLPRCRSRVWCALSPRLPSTNRPTRYEMSCLEKCESGGW